MTCALSRGPSAHTQMQTLIHTKKFITYWHLFFFFNLMLSPLFLSDTLTHSVRNTACLYTAVACADADTSVLSSYYLRCAQRTGVLSPSFHSAGRGWSRDTHSAGAVSVSHEKKLEECFVKLPIASLCSLDVPELFMGNLTPMRNLSAC